MRIVKFIAKIPRILNGTVLQEWCIGVGGVWCSTDLQSEILKYYLMIHSLLHYHLLPLFSAATLIFSSILSSSFFIVSPRLLPLHLLLLFYLLSSSLISSFTISSFAISSPLLSSQLLLHHLSLSTGVVSWVRDPLLR